MKIKFICVSKNGNEDVTASNGYTLQVVLSENPREIWKQYFYFKCRRGTIIRKKDINIFHDEVVVKIENEKNIQEYIDIIKHLIIETNLLVQRYFTNSNKIKLADV